MQAANEKKRKIWELDADLQIDSEAEDEDQDGKDSTLGSQQVKHLKVNEKSPKAKSKQAPRF